MHFSFSFSQLKQHSVIPNTCYCKVLFTIVIMGFGEDLKKHCQHQQRCNSGYWVWIWATSDPPVSCIQYNEQLPRLYQQQNCSYTQMGTLATKCNNKVLLHSSVTYGQICAKISKDCGFLHTSMKLGRVVDHDSLTNFQNGTILDLTFGDLQVLINYKSIYCID